MPSSPKVGAPSAIAKKDMVNIAKAIGENFWRQEVMS